MTSRRGPARLHDGKKRVSSIAVMCLVNDNENWLRHDAFPAFREAERLYFPRTRFSYYFYENGSKDATVSLIRDFLQEKDETRRAGRLVRGPDHGGRC